MRRDARQARRRRRAVNAPALGGEDAARRMRRTASLELAIGAVVLVLTALLVVTPPPG
jgi:putative copper export protein